MFYIQLLWFLPLQVFQAYIYSRLFRCLFTFTLIATFLPCVHLPLPWFSPFQVFYLRLPWFSPLQVFYSCLFWFSPLHAFYLRLPWFLPLQVFYWTHMLYIPFWILLILHGPIFWMFFIAPGVIFVFEKIFRSKLMKRARYGNTHITEVNLLPSGVSYIKTEVNFLPPGVSIQYIEIIYKIVGRVSHAGVWHRSMILIDWLIFSTTLNTFSMVWYDR